MKAYIFAEVNFSIRSHSSVVDARLEGVTMKNILNNLFIISSVAIAFLFAIDAFASTPDKLSSFAFGQQIISNNSSSIVLTGGNVRDHRSCAPNCGDYNTGGGFGHGGGIHYPGRGSNPPAVSHGNGEGGVTVTPSGTSRGPSCLGNWC